MATSAPLLLALALLQAGPAAAGCAGSPDADGGGSCQAEEAAFIQRPPQQQQLARPAANHSPAEHLRGAGAALCDILGPMLNGSSDYVRVPNGGWFHKSCVITVPDGTKTTPNQNEDDQWRLTFPNGTERMLAQCKYPSSGLQHLADGARKVLAKLEKRREQSEELGLTEEASAEGVEGSSEGSCVLPTGGVSSGPLAMYGTNVPGSMAEFTSVAFVPTDPVASRADAWLYWWIGAMPKDYAHVLQPVLMYNQGLQGGTGWAITSWDCCPGGNQIQSEAKYGLVTHEPVVMSIRAKGSGSYEVSACATNGVCSTLERGTANPIVVPLVQYETYNVADEPSCDATSCPKIHCDYLPTSPVAMNDLKVSPPTEWGSTSSRCWSLEDCGWSISRLVEGYAEPALWAYPPR